MRIPFSRFLLAGILLVGMVSLVQAAGSSAPVLTIELRDGSRIVGTSLEKSVHFHSSLLGNLKFDVTDICRVDCVSSNLIRVTTVNGDSLNVSFADSEVTVKTSFGKVELPVDSIRKIVVSGTGPVLNTAGLVGFWSGDNQGKDSVSGTDAVLTDIAFEDGMGGQAFSFNGVTSSIRIPASRSLDIGADDGFTIMAWIKPADVRGIHPLFAWYNDVVDDNSLQLWIGLQPEENGVLRASIPGAGGNPFVVSHEGVLVPGVFQHVALTYDKTSGLGVLYVNGVVVAQRQLSPQIVPETKYDLCVSFRDDRAGNWSTGRMFSGLMNDIAVYSRVLSASEIQAICTQESHGEVLTLPASSSGWQELMNE